MTKQRKQTKNSTLVKNGTANTILLIAITPKNIAMTINKIAQSNNMSKFLFRKYINFNLD
jgi:hypothetical protein